MRKSGRGEGERGVNECLDAKSHGTLEREQTSIPYEGMILARTDQCGVGGWMNRWQRVGTERGGMRGGGVISTKSVPYDTHSHGLCLDSLFLSV